MIIKHFIKLIIIILSMWVAQANAEYKFPLSVGVNKDAYVVNADGTFVNTTRTRLNVGIKAHSVKLKHSKQKSTLVSATA